MYIRLSDADKDLKFKTESESIADQRALLHRNVDSHSEFAAYEMTEFVDDGYSGTNAARPSFERMIESLKNGDAGLVKDFSRFFRDYESVIIWSVSFRFSASGSYPSTTATTATSTKGRLPAWRSS